MTGLKHSNTPLLLTPELLNSYLTTLLVRYFRGAGLNLRSPRNWFEILGCKTASLAIWFTQRRLRYTF